MVSLKNPGGVWISLHLGEDNLHLYALKVATTMDHLNIHVVYEFPDNLPRRTVKNATRSSSEILY